uniref:Uncharacterized protein n=1 Tax=Oryza brachyantha TaxID=4533 RepID=J3MY75_ORYBR
PLEVRVEQCHPLDSGAAVQAFLAGAQCEVVRDVSAGAVPGNEEARQVAVLGEPLVRPGRGVRQHPLERRPRVVVRGRERVLRREAVVHRHGEDAPPGRERVEVGVVDGRERRLDDERAAVEVEQHGHLRRGAEAGEVEPRADIVGRVNGDVPGRHAGERVRGRRHHVGAHEPLHPPALVLDQERGEVELDLRVGVPSQRRHAHPAPPRPRAAAAVRAEEKKQQREQDPRGHSRGEGDTHCGAQLESGSGRAWSVRE